MSDSTSSACLIASRSPFAWLFAALTPCLTDLFWAISVIAFQRACTRCWVSSSKLGATIWWRLIFASVTSSAREWASHFGRSLRPGFVSIAFR